MHFALMHLRGPQKKMKALRFMHRGHLGVVVLTSGHWTDLGEELNAITHFDDLHAKGTYTFALVQSSHPGSKDLTTRVL